jgi:ribosomal protein S18 acetylase RimI-like enzyme
MAEGDGNVRFEVVDPASPEAIATIGRYLEELATRFPDGFDPAAGGQPDLEALRPPAGAFLVGRLDDRIVACGGVQRLDEETAEVKRMWVDPECRGQRLGSTLLGRLEEEASAAGRTRIVLDTNGTLTEAIALYERAGYAPVPRYNDNPYAEHWFAKSL